jgi:hypothetical protein
MGRLSGKAAIITGAGQGIAGNTIDADGGAHINGVAWAPALPD